MMRAIVITFGLLAVVFAGCTGSTGTTGDDFVTPEQDSQGRYIIEMEAGLSFSPEHAVVPIGATVVFVNDGGTHDVQSEELCFKSPMMNRGDEYEVTVDQAGDFDFWCNPHKTSGMTGVLRVTAA